MCTEYGIVTLCKQLFSAPVESGLSTQKLFYLRVALFWDITQRMVVISCRLFRKTYW
jgi:hypothetical protein